MQDVYDVNALKDKLHPIFDSAPIHRAILFGSYAKGQATASSDLDIVLDSQGELRGMMFYSVLEDIVSVLNKKVDLFEISEIRRDTPIMHEIMSQGVVLYDRKG